MPFFYVCVEHVIFTNPRMTRDPSCSETMACLWCPFITISELSLLKFHESSDRRQQHELTTQYLCKYLHMKRQPGLCLLKCVWPGHVSGVYCACVRLCVYHCVPVCSTGLSVITDLVCVPAVCVWVTLNFSLALQLGTKVTVKTWTTHRPQQCACDFMCVCKRERK